MQDDHYWLRHTFRLADEAAASGEPPFAAALVSATGELLMDATNAGVAADRLAHAELVLCREASSRWTLEELAGMTLYSSTEPCAMCAGVIGWTMSGRLVFGLSQASLATGLWAPRFRLPFNSTELLAHVEPPIEMIGPLLEDEAERAHRAWIASEAWR